MVCSVCGEGGGLCVVVRGEWGRVGFLVLGIDWGGDGVVCLF